MIKYTKASVATYLDAGGILRTVDANKPKFKSKGLLLENSATNIKKQLSNVFLGSALGTSSILTGHTSNFKLGIMRYLIPKLMPFLEE